MIRKILAGGALLLILTQCSMAPEYSRPAAPVPDAWPQDSTYAEPAAGPEEPPAADLPWHEFIADGRLRQVVAMALANNRDLRLAALNVERARAFYRIQRAELLPALDAVGSAYKERIPADLSRDRRAMTAEQYNVDLGITAWEIDFFGRIRSLSRSALEEYFATEYARRSARILLISEVTNAYLTLAADRENLDLARATLESQLAALKLIRRRFEVGLAQELELRQVQTRVESARVDVARYTLLVAQDQNALNLLAGTPVPPDLTSIALDTIEPLRRISAGASSEVLLRRPDIQRAESLLKAAYANIGAARAALFPRISLTTSIGTASSELSGLFDSGSGTWLFAPQVAVPVFDPRAWAALRVTKVDREIALTRYEGAIQTAFREVADTLAQSGTLGEQIAAQQALVEAAAGAYRISNLRYTKGTDIYLNVLDAQRSLYAAQQGLIAIRLADLANQVRFYTVLGGGSAAAE